MSMIGHPAPQFTAQAVVEGGNFKTVSLSDFKGKWVVLFFYPLDFTFVCPTELIASNSTVVSTSSVAKSETAKSGGFGLGMIGNLFGGSAQPAAAPTATASNAAPTPQAPAPAANAPFYKRWLGFGETDVAVEPAAVPLPAKVPLPPKRQAQAPANAQIAMTTPQ